MRRWPAFVRQVAFGLTHYPFKIKRSIPRHHVYAIKCEYKWIKKRTNYNVPKIETAFSFVESLPECLGNDSRLPCEQYFWREFGKLRK